MLYFDHETHTKIIYSSGDLDAGHQLSKFFLY